MNEVGTGWGFYPPTKQRDIPDPRVAISQHIGWVRSTTLDTDYTTPEPDNYNFAILADHAIDCKFVKDQVFYLDRKGMGWWSVYYVPDNDVDLFTIWMKQQRFKMYWSNNRSPKVRPRRRMLYSNNRTVELTLNERLYAMGYFKDFSVKYLGDDDAMLLERLGPARAEVYKDYSD